MKYVCLVYLVEKDMSAMTKLESDACTEESLAYDDTLGKAGHLIVAHALQPVETATTIRVRNGKVFSTDGPFAETKEQLGVSHTSIVPIPPPHLTLGSDPLPATGSVK